MATAPTYTPDTSFGFSITLGLGSNDKDVTISASDIANVKTKGLTFQLPTDTTVELGSLSDFITWINAQLAKAIPSSPPSFPATADADWPDFLKNVFNGILTAEVSVTRLMVEQAPQDTSAAYPPLQVHLTVVATAATPISIISGLFSIKGGGLTLDRTYTTTPGT